MFKRPISKLLFSVLVFFCCINQVSASHLGAADIWAVYIGNTAHPLRYVIHLDVYRACEPNQASLSNQESVTWSSDSCQFASVTIPMYMQTDDTLDQLCPNYHALNSCRQPASRWPGFEKRSYVDTVDLPNRCVDWHFTWLSGARNGGILNLCTPSGQDITVDCHFNNLYSNQSSPRFTVLPIPYLCLNQPDQFFNGPYDPNGDSLFVENVQPLGCVSCTCGPNGEIPYVPSYSLVNPILSTLPAGYIVDPITGIATFTPSLVGKFVLAFKVSKYDPITKVLMGSTRRDVQVSVLTCNAPPPVIDSMPLNITGGQFIHSNGTNTLYTCPNTPINFTMNSFSQSGVNSIFLSLDTALSNTPGSTFTVSNNGTPSNGGTFSWTPGDTSVGVHTVTFTATDSTCTNAQPVVLKSYLTVNIDVITGINAIPKTFRLCPESGVPVTLNVVGLPPTFGYSWIDTTGSPITNPSSANPTVNPQDTTEYFVSVTGLPPSCKSVDTVFVNVDNTNHISITPVSPIILCKEGTVDLIAHPVGNKPATNLPCGIPSTPPDMTTPDSVVILPTLGSYGGASNNANSCSPFTGNGSAHHQYLLKAKDMLNSGMISGALTGMSFSIRVLTSSATYNNVSISLMCTTLNSVNADGSLIPGGTQVYASASPLTIAAAGYFTIPFNSVYNWDTTQNLLVDICYSNSTITLNPPSFDYFNSGYPSSTFVFNDADNVCTGAAASSGGFPLYQIPVIRFNYFHAPTVPFYYDWVNIYGSHYFSDSTTQMPKVYVDTDSKYYVISRGKSGCAFMDSVTIYVDPPRHPYVYPSDTIVCVNSPVQLIATDTKNGWKWYQNKLKPATSINCDTCQTIIALPDTTTSYIIVFKDSVGCADTAYSRVQTIPYPAITLGFKDTTIKYGSSIRLVLAPDSPGVRYNYVWTPPFTLDDQYLMNPTATPTVPTVYSVIAYNQFCPAYDTINVNIDYRSNIFVPSAFTPNHDGKNDIFRIANLTYERVIEFRIFNRWGQEIFNATDNHGWDGTWNGNLLDIGAYNYIIRVVYPDGVQDNFQGTVTLIR